MSSPREVGAFCGFAQAYSKYLAALVCTLHGVSIWSTFDPMSWQQKHIQGRSSNGGYEDQGYDNGYRVFQRV